MHWLIVNFFPKGSAAENEINGKVFRKAQVANVIIVIYLFVCVTRVRQVNCIAIYILLVNLK